jgi:hypothetical protein
MLSYNVGTEYMEESACIPKYKTYRSRLGYIISKLIIF